jgi:transaldolase
MVNRDIGFSLWLDFIERDFLANEFTKLIENGIINGATSNPSIFANSIMTSPAYKEQLATLDGLSPKEKYEALAIEDIKNAAIALRPLYDEGNDGYISIEVDPFLANDYKGTVAEGKRLFRAIGEPNVMIKVPATKEGYIAMRQLMSNGISVNATLIFSPIQAKKALRAMQRGLSVFENSGGRRANGVLSVFVSRFDRMLDDKLAAAGVQTAKTGIYNAAKIYNIIESAHTPAVKVLFASTGVKEGLDLPTDYYIKELVGFHTVNTAPLSTIEAYVKAPATAVSLPISDEVIAAHTLAIQSAGISIRDTYTMLLEDGMKAFKDSFTQMLKSLE